MWISHDTDISELPASLSDALAHWRAGIADGADIPARSGIDPPLALTRSLPTMIIFDIERPDGLDGDRRLYRYRLMGTDLTARAGRDLTGKLITEAFDPQDLEQEASLYRRIETDRICYFGERISMLPNRKAFERYRRLLMPLTLGGETVEQIWVVLDFD